MNWQDIFVDGGSTDTFGWEMSAEPWNQGWDFGPFSPQSAPAQKPAFNVDIDVGKLIQGFLPQGGPGGVVGLPCPEDDKFSRVLYPRVAAKARTTGYPATSYWFGNLIVVTPDGKCRRAGNYPSADAAVEFLTHYGATVSPVYLHIGEPGDDQWMFFSGAATPPAATPTSGGGIYTGFPGGSSGVVTPTGGGSVIQIPPGGAAAQMGMGSIGAFLPWILAGGAVWYMGQGKKR